MRQLRLSRSGISVWPITLLASVLVCGCYHPRNPLPLDNDNYKLPSKVADTSDAKVIRMMQDFNRTKVVTVVATGSDYLISMPSAALFPAQSPRLTWQSYALLNQIAVFMKQFRKVGVTITAYSSKYVSAKREQALTAQRARAVGDYLWSQGVDSRFIFTEGAGSDKPITAYADGGDNSPNSRIEITFRDTIV